MAIRMTPDGVIDIAVRLNGTNGSAPRAGLALGKDGNFMARLLSAAPVSLGQSSASRPMEP